MALDSPVAYERLNEHLKSIMLPLEEFAERYAYVLAPPMSRSRYPEVRLTLCERVSRSIQIAVNNDAQGKCFDSFFPEIPYTLFGAAWIDDLDARVRWHAPSIHLRSIAYCDLEESLPQHLKRFHNYLSGIDEHYIRSCANRSKIASPISP